MQALVVDGDRRVEVREVPMPARSGECLVRVTLAGVCATDLHILRGYADYTGIPGHEFVGVVEEAPAGHDQWRGLRVVGEINVGCGRCAWCGRGEKEHCPERTVLGIKQRDGAFAQFLTLPVTNLHEVPAALDDHVAVFTEPVAAACRILEQVVLGSNTQVAVIGDGRMGLLTAQVLRSAGAQTLVIGRHEEKLAIARGLGLDAIAHTARPVPGKGRFDVVVEVSG
ncbi:MAG: alcohol dehydrogenase catalytic domain-containing protein, partial [Luteitalea sp.]|nr:alcohol dehydrogenase catalytic domain-containing protein [Luteitalea sp.]